MENLTRNDCLLLKDFIENNVFDMIRRDEYIDNVNWLVELVHIYDKLDSYIKEHIKETD